MIVHTCKNCGHHFEGKYCNLCGEKVYTENDKRFKHLVEEGLHFITHFEGTFFTTLRTMFTRPGEYSLDYTHGLRKKYFKPVSLFFILVILYLLFPVFEGLNMQLKFYESGNFFGKFVTAKVNRIMTERNLTYEQVSELFHHAGEKTSKFLLFLQVPFMAFVSWLLTYKKKNLFFDHLIFSLEVCSFFILWGFLLLPFFTVILLKFFHVNLFVQEMHTAIAILAVFFVYLLLASRRFFKFSWLRSILFSLAYSIILMLFIQTIYKFILFMIAIALV